MVSNSAEFYLLHFFFLYMDDLSVRLPKLGLGTRLAGNVLNHLGYVDDLYLLSLTNAGMQRLLDCCDQYALEHDLVYNGSKSVCMLLRPRFRPKGHKCPVADFYLSNGNLQYVNSHKYLGIILEIVIKTLLGN